MKNNLTILDYPIKRLEGTDLLCLCDLLNIGNEWRKNKKLNTFNISDITSSKKFIELSDELKNRFHLSFILNSDYKFYVHPFLFLEVAIFLMPEYKIDFYMDLVEERIFIEKGFRNTLKKKLVDTYCIDGHFKVIEEIDKCLLKNFQEDNWERCSDKMIEIRERVYKDIYDKAFPYEWINHEIVSFRIKRIFQEYNYNFLYPYTFGIKKS